MVIDKMIDQIKLKKNPCIVGIDPEWSKLPDCYKSRTSSAAEVILQWAMDVIDSIADIVVAIKPQIAFFEVYGFEGIKVFQQIIQYAHEKGLLVIDDSKRNDIGNTAKAYAYAHLSKEGPINADFLTVSPFLGTDSLQPFVDVAIRNGKGLFIWIKTSNPSSSEISDATNDNNQKISHWLANYIDTLGKNYLGRYGYSPIGAVVGATFPEEATRLRELMKHNFFLVPGYGAQGGNVKDIVSCFQDDGLGAIINSSRGILYHYLKIDGYDNTRTMYLDIVRMQALEMRRAVTFSSKSHQQ